MSILQLPLLAIFFSLTAFSQTLDGRQKQIISIVNEEIIEIKRLAEQTEYRNPNLLMRLAELYLEKARLYRDAENNYFLSIDPRQRSRVSKKKVYRNSTYFFAEATKVAKNVIRKYRRFKGKGTAYYIVAFNAKESNRFKEARVNFSRAIKSSPKGSAIYKKSLLALADLNYNQKMFKKAIPLYEASLKDRSSKWWTKDALNLAWCYFKTKRYNKGISLARQVYEKSSDGNYIDMKSTAARDLALFYAQSGKIQEGISFYRSIGADASKRLVSLAKFLMDEGRTTNAEKVLNEAIKLVDSDQDRIKVHLILLNLHQKYGNYEKHLGSVKKLADINQRTPLDKADMETLIFQAKKVSALVQRQIVSKTYKGTPQIRNAKAALVTQYFDVIARLENKKPHISQFLKAETNYSVGKYRQALEAYNETYELALVRKDAKYIKLSLEGMLATLAQKVDVGTKAKFLGLSYGYYLKHFPRTKRSFTIYQKLFQIYLKEGKDEQAAQLIYSFKKNFSQSAKTLEAMVANLMEHYRKNKNTAKITEWVQKIQRGEFRVSAKYMKKIRLLALTMQFENAEKATTKGEKKFALKEYFRIYQSKVSSKEAKKNAAYNIAVLFFELGDMKKTYTWSKTAIGLMRNNDLLKFESSFLSMSSSLFERRMFKESVQMSTTIYKRICRSKSYRKKFFFKNAVIVGLADGELSSVMGLIRTGSSCGIPNSFLKEAYFDVLVELKAKRRWSSYSQILNILEKLANPGELIKPTYELALAYRQIGERSNEAQAMRQLDRYYNQAKSKKSDVPVEGLDIISHLRMKDLQSSVRRLQNMSLRFPEQQFNNILKQKLALLDVVSNKAFAIFEIGSGKGIVKAYQYLIESYQRLVNEIRSFSPPGKSQDYVISFKKSMNELTAPILSKSLQLLEQARNQIKQNTILSRDNHWFFANSRIPLNIEYRYLKNGVLMDRGGAQ